MAKNWK